MASRSSSGKIYWISYPYSRITYQVIAATTTRARTLAAVQLSLLDSTFVPITAERRVAGKLPALWCHSPLNPMRRVLLATCLLLAAAAAYGLDLDIKVDIHGLDGDQETNVRAFLTLEREGLRESRVRLLHRQAEGEILQALQPFGYFKPRIESSLERTEGGLRAVYRVQPGPRIKLSKVEFRVTGPGRDDPIFATGFDKSPGDYLDQALYDRLRDRRLAEAMEAGYLDARYEVRQVRVDLDSYQASVHLELATGPRAIALKNSRHLEKDLI